MAATATGKQLETKGFQINLQFQNNIPLNYGHGTYAKIDFTTFNPQESIGQGRRTSSLEKKHLWEACAEPFCGMKINLVDQDKLLRHSTEPLEAADMKIVYSQKQSTKSLGNNGARGVKEEQKPYWLRNTTYLENNPFNKYSNANEEDTFQVHRESRNRQFVADVFDKDKVAQSFSKCEEIIHAEQGPRKRRKVVNVYPIVPDTLLASSAVSTVLVRFDEDVRSALSSNVSADGTEQHSLIMGVREPTVKDGASRTNVVHSTVVVPEGNNRDKATEESSPSSVTHTWFRDFRMDMQDANLEDSYVLVLDPVEKTAKYLPVKSRTDLKRLDFQQAVPRDVSVIPSKI